MNITVVSACTASKAIATPDQLLMEDFMKAGSHLQSRVNSLAQFSMTAENLYTGESHCRLRSGIERANLKGASVNHWIVSAGFGIVRSTDRLVPYDATFMQLKKKGRQAWTARLGLELAIRQILAEPADLILLPLGKTYLEACNLRAVKHTGGPAFALISQGSCQLLSEAITPILLKQADTATFSAGMVGLKGAVAARILTDHVDDPLSVLDCTRRAASQAPPQFDLFVQ
jgi:hypothetical protein